jgi:hypothetical protein
VQKLRAFLLDIAVGPAFSRRNDNGHYCKLVAHVGPDTMADEIADGLLCFADAVERHVSAAAARADRLTQAILVRAFRGELVPNEAELARREGRNYEPPSALLERIQRERASP